MTVAGRPLTFTTLFAGVGSKLFPYIVIRSPGSPDEADNDVMVGKTAKLLADDKVLPSTVTLMTPDVAVLGTVTTS